MSDPAQSEAPAPSPPAWAIPLFNELNQKLDRILRGERVLALQQEEIEIMTAASDQALADLTAQVTATQAGVQSAIVLLNGIPALLASAGVDPAAIETVVATLKTSSDALVAAVTADGPQPAPPGPVVPTPPAPTPTPASPTKPGGFR